MSSWLQGAVCTSPNTCTGLSYPSNAGISGVATGAQSLAQALDGTDGRIVYSYSEGGSVATYYLQKYAGNTGQPAPGQVAFIMVANPNSAKGGAIPALYLGAPTPTDSGYTIVEVSREYDGLSDFPTDPSNLLAVANAIAGIGVLHPDYSKVDLYSSDNLVARDGSTTYVVAPTQNLPLLQPLRQLGLNQLADQLNAPLKKAVDAGYDRSSYHSMTQADVDDIQAVITGDGSPSSGSDGSASRTALAAPITSPSADPDPVVAAPAISAKPKQNSLVGALTSQRPGSIGGVGSTGRQAKTAVSGGSGGPAASPKDPSDTGAAGAFGSQLKKLAGAMTSKKTESGGGDAAGGNDADGQAGGRHRKQ